MNTGEKKAKLTVVKSKESKGGYLVVHESGKVELSRETKIDAANAMFDFIDSGRGNWVAAQSEESLYGFEDFCDRAMLAVNIDKGVNLDLYLEHRSAIITRIRDRDYYDINRPSRVMKAVIGLENGILLRDIAIWAFKHYGGLTLPLDEHQQGLVNAFLTDNFINLENVRWRFIDANLDGIYYRSIGDDVRFLMRNAGVGIVEIHVVANTLGSAAVYDDLMKNLRAAKSSFEDCLSLRMFMDEEHYARLSDNVVEAKKLLVDHINIV